jgi:hypothetical protein
LNAFSGRQPRGAYEAMGKKRQHSRRPKAVDHKVCIASCEVLPKCTGPHLRGALRHASSSELARPLSQDTPLGSLKVLCLCDSSVVRWPLPWRINILTDPAGDGAAPSEESHTCGEQLVAVKGPDLPTALCLQAQIATGFIGSAVCDVRRIPQGERVFRESGSHGV